MRTAINNCARCGKSHPEIELRLFTNPPEYGGVRHTHFGICPLTQEPILAAFVPMAELVQVENGAK